MPRGTPPKPCNKCGGPKPVGKGRKFCDSCVQCCDEHSSYVRECAPCQVAWRRSKGVGYGYTTDKRKYHRMRNYGMTSEEHDALMAPGACNACGSTERLCVDHNHDTSEVRGLLCNECNLTLGYMHDDISRLEALINYLKERD